MKQVCNMGGGHSCRDTVRHTTTQHAATEHLPSGDTPPRAEIMGYDAPARQLNALLPAKNFAGNSKIGARFIVLLGGIYYFCHI